MRDRLPEHPRLDIPISMKSWQQLLDGSIQSDYAKEDWEIAAEAIDEWVRRHIPETIPMPAAAGYQWKGQFLPAGTLLRTVFGGKNYHCTVEGDQILYNGKPVSPSGFVNAVGGMRRNAWRCTWLLFPDSKDWALADTLRTRARPRRARKPAGGTGQAAAAPAARAPVGVPPAADPPPAQSEPIAASAAGPSDLQRTAVPVPRSIAPRERRRDISLAQPGYSRPPARRTDDDDHMAALLRQELLPLLYRMCACDRMAPCSAGQTTPERQAPAELAGAVIEAATGGDSGSDRHFGDIARLAGT